MLRERSVRCRHGTIGVSMEIDGIRLAESRGGRIRRYASVPFPADMPEGETQLASFLHDCLEDFCPHFRRMPVWSVGHLSSLHVRHMTLPVVRRGSYRDMVYWTFRNEIAFDTGKTLFDYDCESKNTRGADKVYFTACTAQRLEVETLHDLFASAGVSITGIVIPAFAMRNMIRLQMDGQPMTRLGLFVGDESSTVLVVKAGEVHASRVFKTGMQTLLLAILEQHPGITLASAYHKLQEKLQEEPDGHVAHRVQAVFNRLIQQIERTMAADLAEHPDDQFDGLHVMGAIAGLPTLVASLKSSLGLPVVETTGDEYAPELSALAAGAALSDLDHTPNLLRIAVVRERMVRQARQRVQCSLGLSLLLLCLYAGTRALLTMNAQLQGRITDQAEAIISFPDTLQEEALADLVTEIIQMRREQSRFASRWLPVGILQELAHVTPTAIQLTSIDVVFPKRGTRNPSSKRIVELRIQGRVMDASEHPRSTLAAYTVHLENSLLFDQAEVVRITQLEGSSSLSFVLRLESVSLRDDAALPQEGRPL